MRTEVLVFADWHELHESILIGTLKSTVLKNKAHFSFAYNDEWLNSPMAQQIDPDLLLFSGEQHAEHGQNFRTFLDSCPDRWGRLLMKRREAVIAKQENRRARVLHEVDYLLGVHDMYRMGALRFKNSLHGDFPDNNERLAAPPLSSLRELEYAVKQVESNNDTDDKEYLKWLYMLISPGSSLGGARPKSCVIDENNALWIAKFPSRYDDYDIGAWEYVTHKLALTAGIDMAECRIDRFNSHHHTFLTKRFDRINSQIKTSRLHFSSAMTLLGYDDGNSDASYLELAQLLTEQGANTKADLAQLWRRMVFNIAVSNTDDHLRNHGFIYRNGGWVLSPAYDINPVTPANGLHLNITDDDNSLDYELAMQVIDFYRLSRNEAQNILSQVLASVSQWQKVANSLNISRSEQQQMAEAFNY